MPQDNLIKMDQGPGWQMMVVDVPSVEGGRFHRARRIRLVSNGRIQERPWSPERWQRTLARLPKPASRRRAGVAAQP